MSTTVFAARDLIKKDDKGLAQTLTAVFAFMFLLATLAAFALWSLSEFAGAHFKTLQNVQREHLASALRVSAVVIWMRLMQQILIGVEQAYHRYGLMNAILTGQQVLNNAGILCVAYRGGGVVDFMIWQGVVGALSLVGHGTAVYFLIRPARVRLSWNRSKGQLIGQYSFFTWISTLGTVLFSQCDKLVVGSFLNAASLGIYSAITNVAAQINSISALPVQPLLPLVSQSPRNQPADPDLRVKIRKSLQLNAPIALGLGAALCLFAPIAVRILIPGGTEEAVLLFRIAAIIYAIYSLNAAGYFILLGLGHTGTCLTIVSLSGLGTLLLISSGAFFAGLSGAILGNAGYIATLLLLGLGMNRLKIATSIWLGWLAVPLIWFCLVVPINFHASDSFWLRVVLSIVEFVVLGFWFVRCQRRSSLLAINVGAPGALSHIS